MPITQLEWRWAYSATSNRTYAGVVAAVRAADAIVVHGVLQKSDIDRKLHCSLNGEDWVHASDETAIPESDPDKLSFRERYNHKWPSSITEGVVELSGDSSLLGLVYGARFTCSFGARDSSNSRQVLSVRSDSGWRIDGISIRCPGYPIVGGEAQGNECPMRSGTGATLSLAHEAKGADVTVCVPFIYGTGYARRTLHEFTAWYLLLGARRIVAFDSMQPRLEPIKAQHVAQDRVGSLDALSAALGSRFIVVRGLATWDMMRRTRSHMSGQSLAGNMCKAAAGALAVGGRATYVLLPDFDEFLSPPASDALVPHRLATRLAGSLRRLALHVHSGVSVTSLYLDEAEAASRVHRGRGTRRCLSFASVYYYSPMCAETGSRSTTTAGVEAQPSVLQRLWRGTPDNFEPGPSHKWTSFRHWNFFVRSKFLVDATDDAVLTANHECCCRPDPQPGSQCTTRDGRLDRHTCATLEFMPMEHWHVRHFKGSGLADGKDECRSWSFRHFKGVVNGSRQQVPMYPEEVSFPRSWAEEYSAALSNLTRAVYPCDGHC